VHKLISFPPISPQDERFNCEIDSLTGYRTKALLCMPIKDSAGDVIGVAQVINKMNGECFSEIDEKVSGSEWEQWGGPNAEADKWGHVEIT